MGDDFIPFVLCHVKRKWGIKLKVTATSEALFREKESTVSNCIVPFTDERLRFHCCWGRFPLSTINSGAGLSASASARTSPLQKAREVKTFLSKMTWNVFKNVWHLIYSLFWQSDCQMWQWARSFDRVSFNSTNTEILKWNTNRFVFQCVGCKDKLMTLEDFSEGDAYCLFHFLSSALSKERLCLLHEM